MSNVGTFNSVTEVSLFTPAVVPTPTATPMGVVTVWPEAEAGAPTSPLQVVADATASGGQYVTVAAGNLSTAAPPATGRMTFSFFSTDGGMFYVWGRVIAPTTSDDSFWVQMDSGPWVNWNEIGLGSAWHWEQVHDTANGNTPVTWSLNPGSHTLTLAYREDGTQIDRVLITNQVNLVPSGVGP
jgi:hypothetical protein